MLTPDDQIRYLSTLLQIEKQVRHAETPAELGFLMVNDSLRLFKYRQAAWWQMRAGGGISLDHISGIDQPDSQAPFVLFLKRLIRSTVKQTDNRKLKLLEASVLGKVEQTGWEEWSLGHVLWCPMISPAGELMGGLLYLRDSPWSESEIALMERLMDAYSHAVWALRRHRSGLGRPLLKAWRKGWVKWLAVGSVTALMFLPVRLSVLAPIEIIPQDPLIVSAPLDGVIRKIHVLPNQNIAPGDLLFQMDDTRLTGEYNVYKKAVDVAKAEYLRAAQKAFFDDKSKSNLLLLRAQIEQKAAEVDFMGQMLKRTRVRAQNKGIAVFGGVNDWLGKPAVTGEKVMVIADPKKVEAQIWLPVEDAIALETGAETLIFLNVRPDRPLGAVLRNASYEAQVTAQDVLAFRLTASLSDDAPPPRIGLRGTAKIYGNPVSLFYYIMRRPLAAFRQKVGM